MYKVGSFSQIDQTRGERFAEHEDPANVYLGEQTGRPRRRPHHPANRDRQVPSVEDRMLPDQHLHTLHEQPGTENDARLRHYRRRIVDDEGCAAVPPEENQMLRSHSKGVEHNGNRPSPDHDDYPSLAAYP
jgi:hypothetical protein